MRQVVVVGAGVAGLSAIERMRRGGYRGAITVVGAEAHAPYDRPPLSKQVLSGAWDADQVALRNTAELKALGAQWRYGESAEWLDLDNRQIFTDAGRMLHWDGLVIATGARPRRLPGTSTFANVHVLRTLDDALTLRAAFGSARSVVVIGAGFLGCEVAAAARTLGLSVTMVDATSAPLLRPLGQWIGGLVADLHERRGVDLVLGFEVEAIVGRSQAGRAEQVVLRDGRTLSADVVVVAAGCEPNVAWLQSSGIHVEDGVVCDAQLRVALDVVAAGDVANWFNPIFGRRMRVEHRLNAGEQAAVAAANLLGGRAEYAALPYFWSEQYDVRIQAFGDFAQATHVDVLDGDPEDGRFAAIYHRGADGPVAGITWNLPKQAAAVRRLVLDACATRRANPRPVRPTPRSDAA